METERLLKVAASYLQEAAQAAQLVRDEDNPLIADEMRAPKVEAKLSQAQECLVGALAASQTREERLRGELLFASCLFERARLSSLRAARLLRFTRFDEGGGYTARVNAYMKDAADHYAAALEFDPDAPTFFNLALHEMDNGHLARAYAALTQAEAAAGDSEIGLTISKKLLELRQAHPEVVAQARGARVVGTLDAFLALGRKAPGYACDAAILLRHVKPRLHAGHIKEGLTLLAFYEERLGPGAGVAAIYQQLTLVAGCTDEEASAIQEAGVRLALRMTDEEARLTVASSVMPGLIRALGDTRQRSRWPEILGQIFALSPPDGVQDVVLSWFQRRLAASPVGDLEMTLAEQLGKALPAPRTGEIRGWLIQALVRDLGTRTLAQALPLLQHLVPLLPASADGQAPVLSWLKARLAQEPFNDDLVRWLIANLAPPTPQELQRTRQEVLLRALSQSQDVAQARARVHPLLGAGPADREVSARIATWYVGWARDQARALYGGELAGALAGDAAARVRGRAREVLDADLAKSQGAEKLALLEQLVVLCPDEPIYPAQIQAMRQAAARQRRRRLLILGLGGVGAVLLLLLVGLLAGRPTPDTPLRASAPPPPALPAEALTPRRADADVDVVGAPSLAPDPSPPRPARKKRGRGRGPGAGGREKESKRHE